METNALAIERRRQTRTPNQIRRTITEIKEELNKDRLLMCDEMRAILSSALKRAVLDLQKTKK